MTALRSLSARRCIEDIAAGCHHFTVSKPGRLSRSPHVKGWLALAFTWLVLMPLWLAIAVSGAAKHKEFYFASLAFWLAVVLILANWPRCPLCRKSIFVSRLGREEFARPWPSKICSACGTDLRIAG